MAKVDVAIVGTGISGLTAAYRLSQQGKKVLLLEAGQQVGGVIQSFHLQTPLGDALLEAGPNTVQASSADLLGLAAELGLTPVQSSENAKNRYLFFNGQLQAFPHDPGSFLKSPLLSLQGKLSLLNDLFRPVCSNSEITLADFVTHRFGNEILERIVTPGVTGIYAADPKTMSLQATFPVLAEWEQKHKSLIRAGFAFFREKAEQRRQGNQTKRRGLLSFHGGLSVLPQTLASTIGSEHIRLNSPVTEFERLPDDAGYRLQTPTASVEAKDVIFATPAYVTAKLIAPLNQQISEKLSRIAYSPMALVCLGFDASAIKSPWKGFGFLVPRKQGATLLGGIWTHSIFPDRCPLGLAIGTYFQGGAFHPEMMDLSDEALIAKTLDDVRKIHGQSDLDPVASQVVRWPKAIPQYPLGHRALLGEIDSSLAEKLPNVHLLGNYRFGVSLNDCVKQANVLTELMALS